MLYTLTRTTTSKYMNIIRMLFGKLPKVESTGPQAGIDTLDRPARYPDRDATERCKSRAGIFPPAEEIPATGSFDFATFDTGGEERHRADKRSCFSSPRTAKRSTASTLSIGIEIALWIHSYTRLARAAGCRGWFKHDLGSRGFTGFTDFGTRCRGRFHAI